MEEIKNKNNFEYTVFSLLEKIKNGETLEVSPNIQKLAERLNEIMNSERFKDIDIEMWAVILADICSTFSD